MSQPSSLMLLLGIPDIHILSAQLVQEREVVIEVELTQTTIVCHRCDRTIGELDGYDEPHRLNYRSLLGQAGYVSFRPKRFRCSYCQGHPTTSQQLIWPLADLEVREPRQGSW